MFIQIRRAFVLARAFIALKFRHINSTIITRDKWCDRFGVVQTSIGIFVVFDSGIHLRQLCLTISYIDFMSQQSVPLDFSAVLGRVLAILTLMDVNLFVMMLFAVVEDSARIVCEEVTVFTRVLALVVVIRVNHWSSFSLPVSL